MTEKWVSVPEACQMLGISDSTLRRRIKNNKYNSKIEDGRLYISMDEETSQHCQSNDYQMTSNTDSLTKQLQSENEFLRQELTSIRLAHTESQTQQAELHQQIEESRTRTDTIIMQLTQQLERTQMQLEDLRETKTLWQRVRSVFIPNSA